MVTHNPLHRSQRAGLPHWALTLGSDVQAKIGIRMHKPQLLIPARCLPYPLQRTWQARRLNVGPSPWLYPWFPTSCPFRVLHIDPSPGPVSGACFARAIPLGQAPSLPLLRQQDSHLPLFEGFFGTYGPVRLPTPVHRHRAPFGFMARPPGPFPRGRRGISRFPCRKFPCVRGVFDHAGPVHPSR